MCLLNASDVLKNMFWVPISKGIIQYIAVYFSISIHCKLRMPKLCSGSRCQETLYTLASCLALCPSCNDIIAPTSPHIGQMLCSCSFPMMIFHIFISSVFVHLSVCDEYIVHENEHLKIYVSNWHREDLRVFTFPL